MGLFRPSAGCGLPPLEPGAPSQLQTGDSKIRMASNIGSRARRLFLVSDRDAMNISLPERDRWRVVLVGFDALFGGGVDADNGVGGSARKASTEKTAWSWR